MCRLGLFALLLVRRHQWAVRQYYDGKLECETPGAPLTRAWIVPSGTARLAARDLRETPPADAAAWLGPDRAASALRSSSIVEL